MAVTARTTAKPAKPLSRRAMAGAEMPCPD